METEIIINNIKKQKIYIQIEYTIFAISKRKKQNSKEFSLYKKIYRFAKKNKKTKIQRSFLCTKRYRGMRRAQRIDENSKKLSSHKKTYSMRHIRTVDGNLKNSKKLSFS